MAQETFVTRYVLDDSGYHSGAQRVVSDTNKIAAAQKQTAAAAFTPHFQLPSGGMLSNSGGNAMGAIASKLHPAIAIITAVSAGVTMVGGAALNAAMDVEKLERSFLGVMGSADKAKQMVAFLQDESKATGIDRGVLGAAARQITLLGMNVGKWLPVIEKLAAGAGELNAGGMSWATDLVSAAKAGEFERVLSSRGLGQAGLTKADLSAAGAEFDSSGKFTGTIDQFVKALSEAVDKKLTAPLEAEKGGLDVQWKRMMMAFQESLVPFGKLILERVVPTVELLTMGIQAFADVISVFFGDTLPGEMQAGFQEVKKAYKNFLDNLKAGIFYVVAFSKQMPQFILDAVSGSRNFGENVTRAMENARKMISESKLLDEISTAPSIGGVGVSGVVGNTSGVGVTGAGSNVLAGLFGGVIDPLQYIAKAAKSTADNTAKLVDFNRSILGGGDLGRVGLTSEELAGRNSGKRTVNVTVAGDLQPIFNSMLRQLQAQGVKLVSA